MDWTLEYSFLNNCEFCIMVDKLVSDIRKALDNDLYYAAIVTALTLPDICGKAAFPNEQSTKKRYISWYDSEIGKYEKNPFQTTKEEMPYLSGEIIYNLRCSLLHEGNPNIDNAKLRNSLPINHFTLVISKKNELEIYSDSSEISDIFGQHRRSYNMNIRRICNILCLVAEAYYKDNKEDFVFDYDICERRE